MEETKGFVAARLREALKRQRMTARALASELDVTDQTVSRYISGDNVPRPAILSKIAEVMDLPLGFFFKPITDDVRGGSATFFRSLASASKRLRLSGDSLALTGREVSQYVQQYVELPGVRFPPFNLPDDPAMLSDDDIDDFAEKTRRFWGLGDGPIANVVRLLEHHGAVVVRLDLESAALDAFSQWARPEERPYLFLGVGRQSAVRSRFDACHELGHMVLHRHLAENVVARAEVHSLIEKQAHRFAGAFLLPERTYGRSIYVPTLESLLEQKQIWKVSIAAQIVRLGHLQLISERQEKRLWARLNELGWKRQEPLDDVLPPEEPSLLQKSFEIVVKEVGISGEQILAELSLPARDVRAVAGLPMGALWDSGPRVVPRREAGPRMLEFPSAREA
jgi:Zn-dependent peptidase ImmA (M78 family)/transcriptional regulator with XRE-family HTH domain